MKKTKNYIDRIFALFYFGHYWENLEIKIGKVSFNMIYVEGGTFLMGAQNLNINDKNYDETAYPEEEPIHTVNIKSFYLAESPVTQKLWLKVMGYNPSASKSFFKKHEQYPVDSISWDDSREFIERLNIITNQHFRLPTEAEWEYAARGGNKSMGYLYSGSNDINEVGWYKMPKSQKVMGKKPNELGLYDMSGNVWEWCHDKYGCYESATKDNPTGSKIGVNRVLRGGSWHSDAHYCRNTMRNSGSPAFNFISVGMRLALDKDNL